MLLLLWDLDKRTVTIVTAEEAQAGLKTLLTTSISSKTTKLVTAFAVLEVTTGITALVSRFLFQLLSAATISPFLETQSCMGI